MASISQPSIQIFKADAAISKGMVVKHGTDDTHVAKAALATNKLIGIAQSAPTAAEDAVEVSIGGGAKGLAGGTVARGDLLTSDADGKVVATVTALDRIIGVAMQSAVVGDLFDMVVQVGRI